MLTDGVKIEYTIAHGENTGQKETDFARLTDFATPGNNDFLVVNQFTFTGTKKALLKVTVGQKDFTATLDDNPATVKFRRTLPLTLEMPDLNANEKHASLFPLKVRLKRESEADVGLL